MSEQVKIKGRGFRISEHLGAGAAQITDGFGGWEEIARPNQAPITEWTHEPLRRLTVPIMLDGWAENEPVQGRLGDLLDLGRAHKGDPPPVFTVEGPIPLSGKKFVVESISLDTESTLRAPNGNLLRQALTLNLMEYIAADQITIKKIKNRGEKYTVKDGDTYLLIAKKKAPKGSGADEIRDYAVQIAKANGDRSDIRKQLKEGKEIKLPEFDDSPGGGR